MGKNVQGDRRNAVQGKMLQQHSLLYSTAKYRLIKNLKGPSRGRGRSVDGKRLCQKHRESEIRGRDGQVKEI